jgi:type VI secretion system secreted protein Hcp
MMIETFLKLTKIEGSERKDIEGESLDGDSDGDSHSDNPRHGEREHRHNHDHSHGQHTDEIEVIDWEWEVKNDATIEEKKEVSSKTSVESLSITKGIDKASAILMQYCSLGEHISEGKLTCRKNAGEKKVEFLVIELTDVKVMDVSWDRPTEHARSETVKLKFSKFKVKYKQQFNSGAAANGTVEFEYDVANNKEII